MDAGEIGRTRLRIFYGWWIVLGGLLISALSGGLMFYGFGVFFVPLNEEFGWSRAALAGVFAFSRIEGGILGPIEGILIDKFGPRAMMLVGLPMMALGFILLSQINSLLMLYVVYLMFVAFGAAIGTISPVSAAIANWFDKKRGRAFGLLTSGVAVGGAAFLPLLGWWIAEFGWRHAFTSTGVLILAVGIPVALLFRHKPEPYGYLPDGAEPTSDRDTSQDEAGGTRTLPLAEEASEFGAVESLKTSAFWLFGIGVALRSIITSGFSIHFVALMVDQGLSVTEASGLLGAVVFLSLIGRLGIGWLGDRVSKRLLFAAVMGVIAVMMVVLSQTEDMWIVMPVLVVYSISYGGSIVLPYGLQADYFGRTHYATIRGMLHTVQAIGLVAGPVYAGIIYDVTQSYVWAFFGFAVAAAACSLVLLSVRKPVKRPTPSSG